MLGHPVCNMRMIYDAGGPRCSSRRARRPAGKPVHACRFVSRLVGCANSDKRIEADSLYPVARSMPGLLCIVMLHGQVRSQVVLGLTSFRLQDPQVRIGPSQETCPYATAVLLCTSTITVRRIPITRNPTHGCIAKIAIERCVRS